MEKCMHLWDHAAEKGLVSRLRQNSGNHTGRNREENLSWHVTLPQDLRKPLAV